MNYQAQTFWLENLKLADQYNNWIFQEIKPYLGNNVLEIGCGNGNFTVFLAQQAQQLTAIDLNQEYVTLTKTRLKNSSNVTILHGDVTKIELQNYYDTIIMLDVLEHIEHDVATLEKLNQLLMPGGTLIIKVPALNYLYGEMDRVIGHYRRYNYQTLLNTLNKANFSQSLIWYFNLAGIPGWWLNSKVLKRTTPPSQQVSLFNQIVPILSTIESIIKPPIGLSLFAIAVKSSN